MTIHNRTIDYRFCCCCCHCNIIIIVVVRVAHAQNASRAPNRKFERNGGGSCHRMAIGVLARRGYRRGVDGTLGDGTIKKKTKFPIAQWVKTMSVGRHLLIIWSGGAEDDENDVWVDRRRFATISYNCVSIPIPTRSLSFNVYRSSFVITHTQYKQKFKTIMLEGRSVNCIASAAISSPKTFESFTTWYSVILTLGVE